MIYKIYSLKHALLLSLSALGIFAILSLTTGVAHAAPTVDRHMYIWSSSVTTYGTSTIKKWLVKNNISTAIISLTNSNRTLFKKLLTDLPRSGIDVALLVGNNSLLFEDDVPAYFDNLLRDIDTSKLAGGIHLDIEQYARSSFPDYHERKSYYDNLYLDLLTATKEYADNHGLKVSVSIPVFYDEALLRDIYERADTVYLMAYEITDIDRLEAKVSQELTIGPNDTIVALRADDFATRKAFESFLTTTLNRLGISDIAMHDFRRFKELPLR